MEISAKQVNVPVLGLFDITKPTMPRAFNVLEGVTKGQILVDDLAHPSWGVVREAVYGTLYFGGVANKLHVYSCVEHFRLVGEVGIGCWLDHELNDLLPPNPDYDGKTLYFTERIANNDLLNIQLPSGYVLAMRDQSLFEQSFDYESTLDSFGSLENLMNQTLGVVVLYDGEVVCEAATGAPTYGLIEVGVTTHGTVPSRMSRQHVWHRNWVIRMNANIVMFGGESSKENAHEYERSYPNRAARAI
jgi:hypothetical protein